MQLLDVLAITATMGLFTLILEQTAKIYKKRKNNKIKFY